MLRGTLLYFLGSSLRGLTSLRGSLAHSVIPFHTLYPGFVSLPVDTTFSIVEKYGKILDQSDSKGAKSHLTLRKPLNENMKYGLKVCKPTKINPINQLVLIMAQNVANQLYYDEVRDDTGQSILSKDVGQLSMMPYSSDEGDSLIKWQQGEMEEVNVYDGGIEAIEQ
ncbi:hypothetical protein V6N13_124131 [Hibiscus sabdariffa]|uniref:Uncharacterized protein n=1 Tax=Hibiscus sabdariffa TaxID=183260 RepID=A0ABR2S0H3_9ROSI